MQAARVGALLDFLEKPEKVSDTDKAEKVRPALLLFLILCSALLMERRLAVNVPYCVQIASFLFASKFVALHAARGHRRVTLLAPKLACAETPWLSPGGKGKGEEGQGKGEG